MRDRFYLSTGLSARLSAGAPWSTMSDDDFVPARRKDGQRRQEFLREGVVLCDGRGRGRPHEPWRHLVVAHVKILHYLMSEPSHTPHAWLDKPFSEMLPFPKWPKVPWSTVPWSSVPWSTVPWSTVPWPSSLLALSPKMQRAMKIAAVLAIAAWGFGVLSSLALWLGVVVAVLAVLREDPPNNTS